MLSSSKALSDPSSSSGVITVYGVCVMTGKEIPALLAGLIAAVIIEYFGERAVKRLKENGDK